MKERKKQEKAHFKTARAHLGERLINNFQLEQRREDSRKATDNRMTGKFDYSPNFKRILRLRNRDKANAAQQAARKPQRPLTSRPRSSPRGCTRPLTVEVPPVGVCERRLWESQRASRDAAADRRTGTQRAPTREDRSLKPSPPTQRAFGGPKLRTFKLNGKPEKSTFPQYLIDDGHDKFLEELSAGPKANGCHVSVTAQIQMDQQIVTDEEILEREKKHASATTHTQDTIHKLGPDLRDKLLKGFVFARGVTDAANPRREFWKHFDMRDPNARRTFYGEVNTAVAMHRHEVVKDPTIEWKHIDTGLHASKFTSCKPHFKSLLQSFRQLAPGAGTLANVG